MTDAADNVPVSSLLPHFARQQLIKAGQIKDDKARERAINETVARLKINYPQFFK